MRYPVLIALAVATLLALMGSMFVVQEGHSAIVLNLGRLARTDLGPGLHFKFPLVETQLTFDRRLDVLPAEPERYLTSERKDISVDFFAVGRIENLRSFYRATGGDERIAIERLAPIIKDALRNEISTRTLSQVVSGDRAGIVAAQLAAINRGASTLGVHIVDLRIKQIDLPTDSKVIGDVYSRMRAQRQQVASQLRAEGAEQAQRIKADADRDSAVLVAEAERDAQQLRGEGDAQAARLYAGAAEKDPGFYAFQRSLEAYRHAFSGGQTVIVVDKSDPFLQYLKSDR
ncbi:protease modulator HflC [Cognatilysobacter lacus]|uniref:Protein HflC n=1 Tax=Cognatilysobacter lacus TaxID=1643323 RepID=A0A5D8ZB32_9GAMM|nr:protease modulator HflC [Lysobacter lacus]TZF91332.1 protease modulator HflC [Lysobacter lacus]